MLWDELLEEVILHITPLCSLLHILLMDGECVCRTSENCKSLVLQDKCNIEIFLSPDPPNLKFRNNPENVHPCLHTKDYEQISRLNHFPGYTCC